MAAEQQEELCASLPPGPKGADDLHWRRSQTSGSPGFARVFNWVARGLPSEGDTDAERDARKAVDTLAEKLRHAPISVDRVHVGGSLGRRTLVAGAWDVDLLVFINSPKYPHEWTEGRMAQLRGQLRRWLRDNAYPDVQEEDGTHYEDVIQVVVKGREVDVLLVPNRSSGGAADRATQQREALMGPVYANPAGAGRDQTREAGVCESYSEFISSLPDEVKSTFRLLKAWYKYGLPKPPPAASTGGGRGSLKVPSVALELVVVAAYQSLINNTLGGAGAAGSPPSPQQPSAAPKVLGATRQQLVASLGRPAMLDVFCEALLLINAALSQQRVVTVDARPLGCSPAQALKFKHVWGLHAVRIIHPIDPTCNVARPRKNRSPDWEALAAAACELLGVLQYGNLDMLLHRSSLAPALGRLARVKGIALPWAGERHQPVTSSSPQASRRSPREEEEEEVEPRYKRDAGLCLGGGWGSADWLRKNCLSLLGAGVVIAGLLLSLAALVAAVGTVLWLAGAFRPAPAPRPLALGLTWRLLLLAGVVMGAVQWWGWASQVVPRHSL